MKGHYLQYKQCFSALYVPILLLLLTCTNKIGAARNLIGLDDSQAKDKIIALPGQPKNVTFAQYSGYITVDNVAGRALFYWLIESPVEANPSSKPLILWFNGGPGCSSIAYGSFEEIGPFRVRPDGATLELQPYGWNQEANLLFLDSPAFVGFSYSNTSSDMATGDERTAKDAFEFLNKWFQRFPQYNNRPFYIAGESYGGHYIPQLSSLIFQNNKGNKNPIINFKGFLLGNPLLDDYNDNIGKLEYWWHHGLVGDQLFDELNKTCPNGKFLYPNSECNASTLHALTLFGGIDPYSIFDYQYPCEDLGKLPEIPTPWPWRQRRIDQCLSRYTRVYLNRPEVQKAMHANVTGIRTPWVSCTAALRTSWRDSPLTVLPVLKELIAGGLKLWVFSGDTDAVLPLSSTRRSIKALQLKPISDWHPWMAENQQVGGWSQTYEGLTYLTVRGAGHEVPHTRSKLALPLFKYFLNNQTLQSPPT